MWVPYRKSDIVILCLFIVVKGLRHPYLLNNGKIIVRSWVNSIPDLGQYSQRTILFSTYEMAQ
jgi:hypothetical protein